MTASLLCPQCGAPLASPGEPCPRCLLHLGLEPAAPPQSDLGQVQSPARPPRPPPPTPAEMGRHFREIEVLELCGQGGMGIVYKARHTRLDRVVALKILHQDASRDPAFAERFLREARALARLSHPGIVAVHDFGEADGLFYLVMEFVDGVDLRRMIKSGEIAPRQALSIVRELCDALQYAHDEGVVHRDIKPENVMIDRKGRVKIADFGLAKLAGTIEGGGALTATGQVMGTPHYMAPEQVEHPNDVDHRADIYSLGVVMYEMLTGSLPLGRFEAPSRRVHIDVRLDEIVLRTLEREPSLRYQHAVDVKTDVDIVGHGDARSATAARADMPSIATTRPDETARGDDDRPVFVASIESSIDVSRGAWPIAIFASTWIAVGWMFNLGAWGLVWGGLVLLGASYDILVHRLRRIPELAAALKQESRAKRTARAIGAFGFFGLGFTALIVAHIASWERGAASYEPPAEALYLATHDEPDWNTLQQISYPGSDHVTTLDAARFEFLDRERMLFQVHPAVFGTLALAFWLACVLCLMWRRSTASSVNSAWKPSLEIIASGLLGVALVHVVVWGILAGDAPRLVHSKQHSGYSGAIDDVNEKTRVWLLEAGYQVHAQWSGTFVDPEDGKSLLPTIVFAAHASSPVNRWHVSWHGPERASPHLYVTLTADRHGGHGDIYIDLGSPAEGSRWLEDWNRRVQGLLRRLNG